MSSTEPEHRAQHRLDRLLHGHFSRLARGVTSHHRGVLVACVVAFVCLAAGLLRLTVKVEPEDMLGLDSEIRGDYHRFQSIFGSDQSILLLIESPDVFSVVAMTQLQGLHQDLQTELPYVRTVDSVVNARTITGKDDELLVQRLEHIWPPTQAQLQQSASKLSRHSIYEHFLFNTQRTATVVVIQPDPPAAVLSRTGQQSSTPLSLLTTKQTAELMQALQQVLRRHQEQGMRIRVLGGPAIAHEVTTNMQRDMALFNVMAILVIGTLLFALFRCWSGVWLPLVIVVSSSAGTFGLMGWLGKAVTPVSQILPSLLLVFAVGDSVHLLTLFFQRFNAAPGSAGVSGHRKRCVHDAIVHCGPPMLLTSLTTAGGLVSFQLTDVAPIAEFGVIAPLGVLLACALSLTLLPAVLMTFGHMGFKLGHAAARPTRQRMLLRLGRLCMAHPIAVTAAWLVAGVAALVAASHVPFSYNASKLLGDHNPIRANVVASNQKLGWGTSVNVLVDTGVQDGLTHPHALHRLRTTQQAIEKLEVNGIKAATSSSISDLIQDINRALHDNSNAHYAIPDSQAKVAQALLLFELSGEEDIDRLVDPTRRYARINVLVPDEDMARMGDYLAALKSTVQQTMVGESHPSVVTGVTALEMATFDALLTTLRNSYGLAFVVVTPLMMLVMQSFGVGLAMMLPNLLPIVMSLGAMHLLGIPLNLFTIMIGSIALGVATDDTIYFNSSYRTHRAARLGHGQAIEQTLLSSGSAMLTTSLVLSMSFLAYCASSMQTIAQFGLVTALSMMFAFIADVTLAPALMTLLDQPNAVWSSPGPALRKRHKSQPSHSTF